MLEAIVSVIPLFIAPVICAAVAVVILVFAFINFARNTKGRGYVVFKALASLVTWFLASWGMFFMVFVVIYSGAHAEDRADGGNLTEVSLLGLDLLYDPLSALFVLLICCVGVGLAGLVLTVGMSVDANVLINERIREEQRRGRKILDSIETGYKEASTAIFDANITNTIAAALMMYFGSGPIRGFAVVLLIGIITSVFTAVNFTRMLVALWVRRQRPRVGGVRPRGQARANAGTGRLPRPLPGRHAPLRRRRRLRGPLFRVVC